MVLTLRSCRKSGTFDASNPGGTKRFEAQQRFPELSASWGLWTLWHIVGMGIRSAVCPTASVTPTSLGHAALAALPALLSSLSTAACR